MVRLYTDVYDKLRFKPGSGQCLLYGYLLFKFWENCLTKVSALSLGDVSCDAAPKIIQGRGLSQPRGNQHSGKEAFQHIDGNGIAERFAHNGCLSDHGLGHVVAKARHVGLQRGFFCFYAFAPTILESGVKT